MDVHKNARLAPKGREAMVRLVVDEGRTQAEPTRQKPRAAAFLRQAVANQGEGHSLALAQPFQLLKANGAAHPALVRVGRRPEVPLTDPSEQV